MRVRDPSDGPVETVAQDAKEYQKPVRPPVMASSVLFWLALGICGLIILASVFQILDPEGAKALRAQNAQTAAGSARNEEAAAESEKQRSIPAIAVHSSMPKQDVKLRSRLVRD
jgi:hypothetical protein